MVDHQYAELVLPNGKFFCILLCYYSNIISLLIFFTDDDDNNITYVYCALIRIGFHLYLPVLATWYHRCPIIYRLRPNKWRSIILYIYIMHAFKAHTQDNHLQLP